MVRELASIDESASAKGYGEARQEKVLKKYWPGKYTFILKSKIKNNLITKNNNIAIRIPKYKPLNDLLKKINKPLAQTSVNISGNPPLTKIKDVIALIENCGTSEVPQFLIIDGENLKKSKPSKIFDLSRQVLTRLR
jgi:tRNA A37 threonylcarbamoyladenosine synthetase subunit TsaC/SUA5/YrdC